MEAEARHFRAGLFRRLQQRIVVGYLDLFPVDLEFSHFALNPSGYSEFILPNAAEISIPHQDNPARCQ
jgi:hypothetical protein